MLQVEKRFKRYSNNQTNQTISIDGKLNESVWKDMQVYDFFQRDPEEGKPSSQKTAIKVTYDDEAFYVAAHLVP